MLYNPFIVWKNQIVIQIKQISQNIIILKLMMKGGQIFKTILTIKTQIKLLG